jgi:hypothetical protein
MMLYAIPAGRRIQGVFFPFSFRIAPGASVISEAVAGTVTYR